MGAAELSPEARAARRGRGRGRRGVRPRPRRGHRRAPPGWPSSSSAGLVAEDGRGGGAFRHALTQDALYADVPWLQRRTLHRRVAEALEARRRASMEVATQWLGARDEARAREALLRAAAESRAVHAHRDAARAGRQALELWPAGDEHERRIEALEAYADSAELAGELAEAAAGVARDLRGRAPRSARGPLASAQRGLAAVHDLQGDREAAAAARRAAAEAFAAAGRPAEAAVERLGDRRLPAQQLPALGAIELARTAGREAAAAEPPGPARPRPRPGGRRPRAARRLRRAACGGAGRARLALEHGLTSVAAELYQRLSVVLYDSADYRRARGDARHRARPLPRRRRAGDRAGVRRPA